MLHCTQAQEIAQAVGLGADRATQAWASLGTRGAHRSNIEVDLRGWMQNLHGIELDFYMIPVTVKSRTPSERTRVLNLACIPYYEYVAAAYKFGHDTFQRIFLGQDADIFEKYWHNALNHDWGIHHPGVCDARDLKFVVPIQHHSDGAAMLNKIEYNISSVSRRGGQRGEWWRTRGLAE